MKFGVGNVGNVGNKGGADEQKGAEKGVLYLRRVNGYRGIKGRALTNGEIYVRWFEIAEDFPLFAEFVEKPVEVWNGVIAVILGGIYEKEFTKEGLKEILTVSVRLNIKTAVFEFETVSQRIFYYEFPTGLRRIVTPNERFSKGIGELLRKAEINEPIEGQEFPETKDEEIRALFEINEVRAE